MEFIAGRDLGEHLVQQLYFTDKEIKTQRTEMIFLHLTQVFSQKATDFWSEKSSDILY